jgi:hypothetical protein
VVALLYVIFIFSTTIIPRAVILPPPCGTLLTRLCHFAPLLATARSNLPRNLGEAAHSKRLYLITVRCTDHPHTVILYVVNGSQKRKNINRPTIPNASHPTLSFRPVACNGTKYRSGEISNVPTKQQRSPHRHIWKHSPPFVINIYIAIYQKMWYTKNKNN